ncbi:MAG: glycosyltransferase family 2 protein [Chlorobiaceae bacterium]|nr:glycosyltransferase family 2 protein [Chlorobiaceae bacterium]NTW11572.1 glycosyltransferase family 2 protein [Chlorobiaceae bacterium]
MQLTSSPGISIVIPTCNEEAGIASFLGHLLSLTAKYENVEIIVCDSGSDRTAEIVSRFQVLLLRSQKGRALQMNAGAAAAKHPVLYFLHADTIPPDRFVDEILGAVENGSEAGCFQMRFDDLDPVMGFYGWFTRLPFPICRGGDQSLFITRDLFRKIGGFNESMLVMEDIEIISRIEKETAFCILDSVVVTSARKYRRNGTIRLQLIFGTLHLLYALGADQETLVRYYRDNILQ